MQRNTSRLLDRLAYGRLLKHLAVWHFFRRTRPDPPSIWPTVTLVQPVTRGASNLAASLHARAQLDYPAAMQHLLICDASDRQTQAVVTQFLEDFPEVEAEVILVKPESEQANGIATKI